MELKINYEKRKNNHLFKDMQKKDGLYLSNIQNYIPIYNKFFLLNETNYNSVNLNNDAYIQHIIEPVQKNIYTCEIKNSKIVDKSEEKSVFFKMAPLLDPYKYFIGKYNADDSNLFNLPKYNSLHGDVYPKLLDSNNASYVDGLFVFLSSVLLNRVNFSHGLDYYGSFLAIKNNFTLNIIDDIEYLVKSEFFNKNKNTLFSVEDYSYLLETNDTIKKPTIIIDKNISNKSNLSIQSINDDLYENLFVTELSTNNVPDNVLTLQDIKDLSLEIPDLNDFSDPKTTTIKTNSTCSSRTSHTSNTEKSCEKKSDKNEEECETEDEEWEDDDTFDEEEKVDATIPKFPVEVICMECCEDTFDSLISNNSDLPEEEWFSALMQIVMILLTYQKVFSFTHNDLHTNNVMYNATKKKYLYYCYKKKYYKVPTFGRIFKIIDFGRSIYKINDKLFCSDSFQPGADAASQYNTEPYFDDKKPRLEPNYSFDLCRLACSIFDYVVEDIDQVTAQNVSRCSQIVQLINDWCLDDNGINIMYKNNGSERYPDFKLYKMIARLVHKHTPQAQLDRKEFSKYVVSKNIIDKNIHIMNIDDMQSLI